MGIIVSQMKEYYEPISQKGHMGHLQSSYENEILFDYYDTYDSMIFYACAVGPPKFNGN